MKQTTRQQMPRSKFQSDQIDRRKFIAIGAASLGALALGPAAARELGDARRSYGERSPFENATRTFGASVTPATGLPRAKARGRWSPATACAITLPAVEHAVKQAPLPPHPDPAEAQSVSSPLSSTELRGEDASRYCPLCSQRLESRRCKLICNRCGYYMSCADYV